MFKEFSDVRRSGSYAMTPRRCCFCNGVVEPDVAVCPDCAQNVERVALPVCFHCGRSKTDCECGKKKNAYISAFAAPFYYKGLVRDSIRRMKFHGKRDNADYLGQEMGETAKALFPAVRIDLVTYVPMTAKEEKKHGYNQSRLLGEATAKGLILPCENVLCKLYETPRQHTLPSALRSGNVLGVFDVRDAERIQGKRILLCDDICTTGTTLTECAKMLMIYGAKEVLCLTAAVSFPKPREKG